MFFEGRDWHYERESLDLGDDNEAREALEPELGASVWDMNSEELDEAVGDVLWKYAMKYYRANRDNLDSAVISDSVRPSRRRSVRDSRVARLRRRFR